MRSVDGRYLTRRPSPAFVGGVDSGDPERGPTDDKIVLIRPSAILSGMNLEVVQSQLSGRLGIRPTQWTDYPGVDLNSSPGLPRRSLYQVLAAY